MNSAQQYLLERDQPLPLQPARPARPARPAGGLRPFELPFSELKIDQALVQASSWSEQARTIIESVVKLAHGLGLSVCAEGAETSEQLAFLEARSCDRVQGFHLGVPLPERELTGLFQRIERSLSEYR